MKTKFLLPNKYKKIGWVLFGLSILLFILEVAFGALDFLGEITIPAIYSSDWPFGDSNEGSSFFRMTTDDFQFELISTLFIIGALLVSFSRLKNEDEFISKIRLESLVWATFAHFILVIILTLTVYGMDYFNVMVINMFTLLILFIIRFHYVLYIKEKAAK